MAEHSEKPKIGRTLTLVGLHSIVLYDCYILALPMVIVMWKHWQHILLYFVALTLLLFSILRSRYPLVRDVFYLAGMGCLYFHWYCISSADDIVYKTEPFAASGLIGSLPFQIAIVVQLFFLIISHFQQSEPHYEALNVRQEEMTTLRSQAKKMIDVLGAVCVALEMYNVDARKLYAKDLANRLRPMVKAFEASVVHDRSREHAQKILMDIMPIMEEVNGAVTKGEMDLFKDETLKVFWDLSTIFCESKFSGELL
jgi:hypothetical protein